MKLKVTKKVKDLQTGEFLEEGTVIERTEKRGSELIKKGVAEAIGEKNPVKVEELETEEVVNTDTPEPVEAEVSKEVSEPVAEKQPAKPKAKGKNKKR